MSIIQISNLNFQYPTAAKPTLSIDDFMVEKGERVFVFGPSGSGKTTFLEILAGVLVPQTGTVKLLEQNFSGLSAKERDRFRAAHIGYVFQSFNLIPYLSVRENIELPVHLSAERRARLTEPLEQAVEHLVSELGISAELNKPVTELSVGQQQRVAVARALLGKPELILADEPTSALDQDHREKFIKLLFQVCEEVKSTLLFVSHDKSLKPMFSREVSIEKINKVNQAEVQL